MSVPLPPEATLAMEWLVPLGASDFFKDMWATELLEIVGKHTAGLLLFFC